MCNDAITREFSTGRQMMRSVRFTFRSLRHWSLAIAVIFLLSASVSRSATESAGPARSRFGSLPLYFEANQGQTERTVGFLARGANVAVYLHADGATVVMNDSPGRRGKNSHLGLRNEVTKDSTVRVVRMTIEGASTAAFPEGIEPLAGRVNYLLGNDSSAWRSGVTTFGRVQYRGVREGVDVVYYGNNQELEYDFMLAAGVDPSAIVLRFDGADKLRLADNGDLVIEAGAGELRQPKPVAYQTIAGKPRGVAAGYRLLGERTVGFEIGPRDSAVPLVIDPILSYSTYLGGSARDIGWAIDVDAEGRAYIAGDTLSVFRTLPTSGEQTIPGGGTRYGGDAFVARLDFNTNQVLTLGYLTYLGGSGLDGGIGIAVDAAGAAYVTGYTTSSNFPAFPPDVFQLEQSGEILEGYNSRHSDAFVTKLDTNGMGVYSTYLGGEAGESGADIAVDAAGAAYVVGFTESAMAYLITNRLTIFRCTNDVCPDPKYATNFTVVKSLVDDYWVTNSVRNRRATDTNVVVIRTNIVRIGIFGGGPIYNGFPLVNPIQTNNNTTMLYGPRFRRSTGELLEVTNLLGGMDIFVTKLAPDALTAEYSTYLGGAEDDNGTGIDVAPDGSASISGWSRSPDYPVTNALQSELGGVRNAVVAKLSPAGDTLVFSTWLGGRGNDVAYRVAVDAAGATYVAGATGSPDFPSTPGALGRGGIFTSTNGAGQWSASSAGLQHSTINVLLADPFNPGTLYAGTARGVFKSTDSGAAWRPASTGLLSRVVNTLAVEPLTGVPLFAGTAGGLFQSVDGGLVWTNVEPDLGVVDVRSILFDAATGTNLFVGTSSGVYARETYPVTNFVTLVSNDITYTNIVETNVTAWFTSNKGLRNRSVRVLLDDANGMFYAATDGGVYRSTNTGLNWISMNKGLKSTRIRALAIDPVTTSTLYAGTAKGVHKLTDGTNWVQLTNGIGRPPVSALLIDPTSPSVLYAGTTNGLYRSADAGASWTLSQSNLTSVDVARLAFAPGNTSTVFAGTRGTNFFGGTNDAFLVKLAPDGSAFDYALTFGGNRNDEAWDVAVDGGGNAFVTGQTASKNFRVVRAPGETNAAQTNLSGKIDAFVAAFSPDGSTNFLSFYHGGRGTDFGHGIALDPSGNAYIAGRTESGGLPVTNQLVTLSGDPLRLGGKRDGFVTKFLTGPPVMTAQFVVLPNAVGFPPGPTFNFKVSWPASAYEFRLEARDPNAGGWFPITERPAIVNGRSEVILPAESSSLLFRLRM